MSAHTSDASDTADEGRARALRQIEKLLRLAGGTTSPDEAAAAAAKAQDLMLAWNLSEASLGSGDEGRRSEEKLTGGFYDYERDLLWRIADVNFCLHWMSRDYIERTEAQRNHARTLALRSAHARRYVRSWRHHLVGRKINVEASIRMYRYLSEAIERLTRDFLTDHLPRGRDDQIVGLSGALRSRRAVSFRRGVAQTIASKLWDRRQDQLARERREQAEQEAAASRAAAAGLSASTAVTISSLRQSERDANMDVIYGEGWSAKERQRIADQARAAREAEEMYTRWAAAHPEEAAAEEKKRRDEERQRERQRTRRRASGGGSDKKIDWAAMQAGAEAGESIGLDLQVDESGMRRRIGRG